MNEQDFWTISAMDKYGGSFVQHLAQLARHSDATNLALIKRHWSHYWAQYEKMGATLQDKNIV